MDFGARVNGYCSDMTRTFAVGKPCDELVKIYDIVLEAQLKCLEVLRPNMNAADLDTERRGISSQRTVTASASVTASATGYGLEIHESPYASPRSADILVPGSTITVEPGIYVEGLGGVRIEDCCVLTETGYINLCSTTKELAASSDKVRKAL